MKWHSLALVALGLSQAAFSCHDRNDATPANYDALARATGHWEWESYVTQAVQRTPATEGYARQLVFGSDGQLRLRRTNQADYLTSYQLKRGPLPSCGTGTTEFDLITYSTSEAQLPNGELKAYELSQQSGQRTLSIRGAGACRDLGAFERYNWVAE